MADEAPVQIDEGLAGLIDGALERGKPVVVTYVDGVGQPHISFRGSTQGHGEDQLAMWIREASGGLLQALPNNNRITLMYRDSEQKTTYFFYGRAHVETDPTAGAAIYDKTPKSERDKDPDKIGVPVVIDIDVIQGSTPTGRVEMRRA
jgi:hypothetical protein